MQLTNGWEREAGRRLGRRPFGPLLQLLLVVVVGEHPPPPPAISGNPIEREEKAPSGGAAGLAVLLSTSAVGKADPDQPS